MSLSRCSSAPCSSASRVARDVLGVALQLHAGYLRVRLFSYQPTAVHGNLTATRVSLLSGHTATQVLYCTGEHRPILQLWLRQNCKKICSGVPGFGDSPSECVFFNATGRWGTTRGREEDGRSRLQLWLCTGRE